MKLSAKSVWLAKLALGVGVVAWLLSRTDLHSLWTTLRGIHFRWLVPVLVIPHLAIVLSSMKWHALLHARGGRASQIMLLRLYMVGTFFSSFLPSMVGGDVVRVLQLARAGCDSAVVVASTFLERYLGLVALVTLLPLAALQPVATRALPGLWLVIGAASLGIVVTVVLLFARRTTLLEPPQNGPRSIWMRLRSILARSRYQVQLYRGHAGTLAYGYVLSLLFYLSAGVTVWCASRAVGGAPDLWTLLSVTPLVLLVGLAPISVNGLGVLEAGFTWLLTSLGMSLPEALAAALLLRGRALLTAGLGGLIFLADRRSAPPPVGASERA